MSDSIIGRIPPPPIPLSASTREEALADIIGAVDATLQILILEDNELTPASLTLFVSFQQWKNSGFCVDGVDEKARAIMRAYFEIHGTASSRVSKFVQ